MQVSNVDQSLSEVHETVDTTVPRKGWKRILAYIGPAYLVSVGYMDPGNWATDLQGGAKFGYQLIWVLLMSNLMALILQSLSARLGIVRRRDLAQANRETYPPVVNFCLYVLAELAIAACDLAEVLGMAIGIHLLTGLPILWGTVITVLDTFLFLFLQRWGIRKLEAFIIALVAIIGLSFLVQILIARPAVGDVVGGLVPGMLNDGALYIAVGIIGATVMPHNLYLHSALVQTRKINPDTKGIKTALKYNLIDSTIALNAAFLVNTAILVLAATVFFKTGNTEVAKIQEAHHLLEPLLGSSIAPILFAIALIAAGQSSTVTGTMAGQIVMEGYLHLRINPWLRRLLTRLIAIVPALLVIVIYGDEKVDDLLLFSQVILSIQLGFAVIPLIHFVSDQSTMGEFVIGQKTKIMAWLVALILVFLNVNLAVEEVATLFHSGVSIWLKLAVILAIIAFIWLFLMMTFYPIISKKRKLTKDTLYGDAMTLDNLAVKKIQHIAVALDFTNADEKLIAHALSQGNDTVVYQLIHIVESVSARYSRDSSDDAETRKDKERLQNYVDQLKSKGLNASGHLGYTRRVAEIVRIVQELDSDMLVMGAHRHSGFKDYVFGETIEDVRHKLTIPVLIVNVS
ncbi:MAG: hypothetical protein RI983_1266 [Bacteroidota bacterium]|jgi:manganese transport protein